MIVACEKCNSRFALDESVLTKDGSKVQCSSCNHVFTVFPPSEEASGEIEEIEEILRDLTSKGDEPAVVSKESDAFSEESKPEREIPAQEEETLFDIDTLDLSEISDLPGTASGEKNSEGIPSEPDTGKKREDREDDLEFILGDDFEIDEEPVATQSPPGSGKVDFDLSDLEEILKSEREPKPEKTSKEKPEKILKEEPEEPPIEFDIEILDDTAAESTDLEKETQVQREADTEADTPTDDDVIDELDLTEFTEKAPAETPIPEKAAQEEASPEHEFKIEGEKPLELESRKPPAVEPEEEKIQRSEDDLEEQRDEEPKLFEGRDVSHFEAELPPETFTLSGKPKRVRTAFLVLFILILIGGAGYGAYVLTDRMGISIPFVGDLLKMEVQDPGNLRMRILDVDGHFVKSPGRGKHFVISGKVINDYDHARGEIQVTGNLLKKEGQIFESKAVYCGNLIPETELVKMDMDTIDARLSSLAAVKGTAPTRLEPGQTAHFMIVFGSLPQDLEEYSVAVNGSKVVK